MAHRGHWIWFDAAAGDKSDRSLFIRKHRGSSVMHPGDTKTWIHADDSNGELNVKKGGQGYLMYFNLAKDTN